MKVHNIMEELVFDRVDQMYNQVKELNATWLTCSCEHCRLDTASYVLNRIPPKYIVSGRGVNHAMSSESKQLMIDIDSLVVEGMHAVSNTRRTYHDKKKDNTYMEEGSFFNFPAFIGSVYDGTTFEPLSDATVILKYESNPAVMMDYTWQNPCITTKLTKGTFSFWVKPVKTEKPGENKQFHFTVDVSCKGFDPASYNFDVPLVSEDKPRVAMNTTYTIKIQDLCLFPKGTEQVAGEES
ncbi:MAG: late competence development ComFB family protein [Treponemataceae bacterium]|nr:late competence development ComFB family protein [Treponemataceae bacterium]